MYHMKQKVVMESGVDERVAVLKAARALEWPRIQNNAQEMTVAEFLHKYKDLKRGTVVQSDSVVIRGRCACSPRQTPLLMD